MSPFQDPRDQESSLEWGLGPPVVGSFRRYTVSAVLWGMAFFATVLAFGRFVLLSGQLQEPLVPVLVGVGAGFSALLVGGILSTRATAIQVGEQGISVLRGRIALGQGKRACWILWRDVELSWRGPQRRLSRTLGVRIADSATLGWAIDYSQARAIISHPGYKGTSDPLPDWLWKRLGLQGPQRPQALTYDSDRS
jgi:hypothetical protein